MQQEIENSHHDGTEAIASHTRKRRKDGCLTCRQRRVGCGREKPSCGHCQRLKLSCKWPPAGGIPRRRHTRTGTADAGPLAGQRQPDGSGKWRTLDGSSEKTISPTLLCAPGPPSSINISGQGLGLSHERRPQTALPSYLAPTPSGGLGTCDFEPGNFCGDILDNLSFELFSTFTNDDLATPAFPLGDHPSGVASTEQPSHHRRTLRSPVISALKDQPIIAHFLESVSQAATVRTRNVPNHYISLHAVSLFFPPLYAGVLAWSAWHMATTSPQLEETRRAELRSYAAEQHEKCGTDLMRELEGFTPPQNNEVNDQDLVADMEALFCGLMVFCQYEIITSSCPSSLWSHMDRIDSVFGSSGKFVCDARSLLLQRMATTLAAFEVRASMFGFRVPQYALHLGAAFFDDPEYRFPAASGNTASLQIHYLEAKCIEVEVSIWQARERGDTMTARAATKDGDSLYDRITALQPAFDPPRLDASSNTDQLEDPLDDSRTMQIDPYVTCDIFLACWYNALVIYICRTLGYPAPRRSIDRILGGSQTLLRSSPAPSHVVLAKPLFFAGLETRDERQVEWILDRLNTPSARGWGPSRQTSDLLREVRRIEKDGTRKNIGQIMQQDQFNFIL